jgi:hypothetical protein
MATVFLKVANWEEYQHYKDRNPPWIKLHNQLLDSYEFCSLPDASKAHLLAIWMLASRSNNKLPHDAGWISRKISASEPVDLDLLIESGFLEYIELKQQVKPAIKPLASCKQNACLETEAETEESRGKSEHTQSFKIPTVEEITEYLINKQVPNPKPLAIKFFNHYESNGWKVGKNKMKKWKAAISGNNWITEHQGKQKVSTASPHISELRL